MSLICVVGGTNIKSDIRGFRATPPPDIVVATPGRLNDHLDNYNLAGAMQGLSHLIFDEADQARRAKRQQDNRCMRIAGRNVCRLGTDYCMMLNSIVRLRERERNRSWCSLADETAGWEGRG